MCFLYFLPPEGNFDCRQGWEWWGGTNHKQSLNKTFFYIFPLEGNLDWRRGWGWGVGKGTISTNRFFKAYFILYYLFCIFVYLYILCIYIFCILGIFVYFVFLYIFVMFSKCWQSFRFCSQEGRLFRFGICTGHWARGHPPLGWVRKSSSLPPVFSFPHGPTVALRNDVPKGSQK